MNVLRGQILHQTMLPGESSCFFFFLMPEDDLELRSKVINLFTFGNIAGFIGESSPHQTSLSENRI